MGGSFKSQSLPSIASTASALSMTGVRMIAAAAATRGLDPQELLTTVGLAPTALAESDGWVPDVVEWQLWDEGARLLRDPVFGLHVGEAMVNSECPEILYHAARVAPTVGQALQRLVRFFSVFHRRTRVHLEVDGELARFVKDGGARIVPCSHGSLAVLSNVLLRLRGWLGGPFPLREVWFMHPRPANLDEYVRIFAAPLRFERPCNALICERSQLDWQLPTRAPELLELLVVVVRESSLHPDVKHSPKIPSDARPRFANVRKRRVGREANAFMLTMFLMFVFYVSFSAVTTMLLIKKMKSIFNRGALCILA